MRRDGDAAVLDQQVITFSSERRVVGQFEADVSPLFQSKLKTGCRSYFTVEIVGNPFEFRVGRLDGDTRAPRQLELVGQDLHLFGLWNECQRICRRFVLLCTGHTPYEQSPPLKE